MSRIIVDIFQSLANVPVLGERCIRVAITGVKYILNFFINLDGIGYVLQSVALFSPVFFST